MNIKWPKEEEMNKYYIGKVLFFTSKVYLPSILLYEFSKTIKYFQAITLWTSLGEVAYVTM